MSHDEAKLVRGAFDSVFGDGKGPQFAQAFYARLFAMGVLLKNLPEWHDGPARHRRQGLDSIAPRDESGGEVGAAEIIAGELVVSGSDASPILKTAPHAFDPISLSVGESVVGDRLGAGGGRGNDGLGLSVGEQTT